MIGTIVSHYRLTAKIAEGGMGEVFVGFDEALARKVAMKAIREDRRPSAEARARFLREARVLSQLDHPRICRVFDYVAGDEVDFIVMELVEGRSLRVALAAGLPPSRRQAAAEQLAEVLVAAHAAGIVHRDLKPDNVMLDLAGELKVLDFGLARIAGPPRVAASTAAAADGPAPAPDLSDVETLGAPSGPPASQGALGAPVTALGAITGTLAYMSPEQARGEPATTASDMYSLGIMLQELFTGRRAYPTGITPAELLQRARRAETQPVTGIARDLAALLERLKSPAPAARPTAVEALARLRWIREAPRRRLRRLAAAALVAAAALGTLKYTLDLRRERAIAVAARREAEQRRGQAEELVQFMLGDLRARLEPVGRLDALDGVASKALEYFASMGNVELADSDRFRRARALTQIGEIRIAQGDLAAASRSLREAHALARDVVAHQPSNGERLMGLGAIEFWIGNVHWLQGDLAGAEKRFGAYLDVAERLVKIDGNNPEWRLELSHAHSNLGSVHEARGNVDAAIEHFRLTVEARRELARSHPGRGQKDLADSLSWLGEALLGAGDLAGALEQYQAGRDVLERLVGREPENAQHRYLLGIAHHKVGATLESLGRMDEAVRHFELSLSVHRDLEQLDPGNADWRREVAVAHQRLGMAIATRDPDLGLRHLRLAATRLGRLHAADVSNAERRFDLARARRDMGRGLVEKGETARAVEVQRSALAALAPAAGEADERRRRILQAEVWVALGEALAAGGRTGEPRDVWERAASALEPLAAGSRDPRVLAPLAQALLRLGRKEDARPVVERLRASGYRRWDYDRVLRGPASG